MPEPLTLAVTWPPGLEVLYGSSAGGCCPLLPVTHRTRKEPGGGHSILARFRTVL